MNTLLVFCVVFFFTSLQGYRVIYQFKLIDLFHAAKKGEALPKAKLLSTGLGIALLATGYTISAQEMTSSAWRLLGISTPIVVILLTVAGTFLLFHSVTVYVFTKMKHNTHWAWRGLNLMTVSQILYRIRGNAKTLTLIAVLSATTLTAGGAVFSLYYNTGKDAANFLPNTFMWAGAPTTLDIEGVLHEAELPTKTAEVNVNEATYELTIVSQSDYNALATFHQVDTLAVENGTLHWIDPYYDARFSQAPLQQTLQINDKPFTVADMSEHSLFNQQLIYVAAVVSDTDYAQLQLADTTYQIVNVADPKEQLAVSQALQQALGDTTLLSFPQAYSDSLQSLGVLLFVGSFLGLVFLIATGSIIYFKMMTELEEDRDKYIVLRKIGVGTRDLQKTIRAQVGIVFALPLAVGILHALFALNSFSNLFMMNITQPVFIWIVVYTAVYALYYVLTVRYFNKTILTTLTKD